MCSAGKFVGETAVQTFDPTVSCHSYSELFGYLTTLKEKLIVPLAILQYFEMVSLRSGAKENVCLAPHPVHL